MRILATGPIDPVSARAGFSLVELMTVIVIIGVAAGAVVMVLPTGGPTLDEEARRFSSGLQRIARDSVLTGRMIGIRIEPEGYQAYRLRRGTWEPLRGEDASGQWDEETQVTVGQGAAIRKPVSDQRDQSDRKEPRIVPQIRFDPIGIGTPFWLRFERAGSSLILRSDGDGMVEIEDGANGAR